MSLKNTIMPSLAQALTSQTLLSLRRNGHEFSRKITGKKHELQFYFRITDPYSYLLLQLLPELLKAFPALVLKPKVLWQLPAEMYPEPQKLEAYALKDAAILAPKFRLKFPSNMQTPNDNDAFLASRILLKIEDSIEFIDVALALSAALWSGDSPTIEAYTNNFRVQDRNSALGLLLQRKDKLLKDGHYLAATLHYGGEWYWGIDRINHLVTRLKGLGLNQTGDLKPFYSLSKEADFKNPASLHPLYFYFSFRSPYSYLALGRTISLAEKYQMDLHIKPVLPMVMRGLPVPAPKKRYILGDSKREAQIAGLPFGKICDPLGQGVENCMALYNYALRENRATEFLQSVTTGIWSEGADVSKPKVLAELLERAGLNWLQGRSYLKDESWRKWAESNRLELTDMGLWGVPCFYYNEQTFWGQDRLWALEQVIQDT